MTNHYIRPNWNAPRWVHAVTTVRTNGFSQMPYNSFNLGHHTSDNPPHISANRIQLCQELNLPTEPIWLEQIHGNKAICADNALPYIEADASYATKSNVVCVVLTADCLPILLCDKDGTKIAAIHAGWKGLSSGIIENTVTALKINPEKLLVWLCPAIGSNAFIVGTDVYEKFTQYNPHAKDAFQPYNLQQCHSLKDEYECRGNPCGCPNGARASRAPTTAEGVPPKDFKSWLGASEDEQRSVLKTYMSSESSLQQRHDLKAEGEKWLANIYTLARQRLTDCGIISTNIYGGEYCTYSDSHRFFSYRRDGEKTGRMASLIWLTAQ